MALTQTQVSQLYVSIFNRASEGEGNTFWQTAGTKAEIANSMLDTQDAKDYFGSSLDSNQAFIEKIYQNTLNKTVEDDAAGIKFWVDALESGMSRGEVVAGLIEAIESYKDSTDAKTKAAYDQFNNRVEVSNYMAQQVEKAPADYKTTTQFAPLGELVVTDSAVTVETAKKEIYEAANPGLIQVLEVGRDNLKGTNGDDTFLSYVSQNDNGQQVNTLGSGDIINGGAGTDSLVAEVTTGSFVGGSAMAIAPNTKSVENIVLTAVNDGKATGGANSTVTVDAKNMDGVLNIASDHSDANLLIKNMIGVKKGVYGGTAEQTVTMAYSGNKDSLWAESDMTVFYDQDYLTRTAEKSGAELEVRIANIYKVAKVGEPTLSFEKITINLADGAKINGKSSIEVDITSAQGEKGDAAYAKVVELMNDAFTANGWANVSAKTIAARDAYFSDDVETYTAGSLAGQYLPILVTNTGAEEFAKASFVSNSAVQDGNRLETSIVDPTLQSDTPVSINVDLEKVGNAADGGALTIGSMNKNHDNKFNEKQSITTTKTVAGFDEFNVSVGGDKTKNSSLSALQSTDNTLRTVTIDSKTGSDANLKIGNSNTKDSAAIAAAKAALAINPADKAAKAALDAALLLVSAQYAESFKDVQIMNASNFAGDLTLNAGFTDEIVAKYLNNITETTLNGLNNAGTELASFKYDGGKGNDTLNIALDLAKFAKANFVAADTNGLNVFKMNINGNDGNDTITLTTDSASDTYTMTNITVNGGNGNDLINLDAINHASWSYNVAFNGNFGHDTIKAFDKGCVALTDEKQTLDLTGFVAHVGEVITVTVGNQTATYTVLAADFASGMTDIQIAAKVQSLVEKSATPATDKATQKFNTKAVTTDATLELTGTKINVNEVTVTVMPKNHVANSADTVDPIHTATSTTQVQGGLLSGGAITVGADTLDFSAYNVKGVVIGKAAADLFGTDAGTVLTAAAKAAIFTTAGNQFIYLEASKHDASIYDVYMATSKVDASTTLEVNFETAGNAVKGAIIGSIQLDDAADFTGMNACQLLF